jgi:4-amino-4-deoxy-L-arabinose transferase-like glycosyltransferase
MKRDPEILRRALPWLALAALLAAIAWGLGGYALLDPDEGRNAEVAREMTAGGDYVLPRLDGLPYLDKPVLFFAADALSQRLLGASETAARLPALLFAFATAALTAWFAGRLFGRRARWIAGVAALAAPLPIAFARTVIFDSALTFFMVAALCAFYLAVAARAPHGTPAAAGSYLPWTALAWAAMGLGVLTKGPVALAVPLLAAVPFAAIRRASRAVWHPLGPALLALLVGPWVWAVSRRVPELLHYVLFTETWQRVTTPEMNREGPIWFFLPCLLAGALPWSVLALAGWRRSLRPRGADHRLDPPRLYLALWIALPLVLFSLSHSKRPQYILPLLPAVAIMAAKVWLDAEAAAGSADAAGSTDVAGSAAAAIGSAGAAADPAAIAGTSGLPPGARAAGITWLALAIVCATGPAVLTRVHAARLAHAHLLPATLLGLAVAFLLGAALVLLGVAQGRRRPPGARAAALLLAGLVLPMAALPAILLPLLAEIGSHRSSRDAAAAIGPRLPPGGEVVAVHAFPPSLPFYLRRTLLVATPRGRELTSNYVIAYFQKWLAADPRVTPLRPKDWWRGALAACDRPLVFVTWADDEADRAALAAAGLPLIVANDRMAAYGPCAPRRGPTAQ